MGLSSEVSPTRLWKQAFAQLGIIDPDTEHHTKGQIQKYPFNAEISELSQLHNTKLALVTGETGAQL